MQRPQGTVAPKERINISFRPNINSQEEKELPLKLLMMGDYTGKQDARRLEDRKPISINKDNMDAVLSSMDVSTVLEVPNTLSSSQEQLTVMLQFTELRDFDPDRIIDQVPELKKLLDIRQALVALKGPLGNVPTFRQALQTIVNNPDSLSALFAALNMQAKG